MDLETNMSMAWAEKSRVWETMFRDSVNAPGLFNLEYIREQYQNCTGHMRTWDSV